MADFIKCRGGQSKPLLPGTITNGVFQIDWQRLLRFWPQESSSFLFSIHLKAPESASRYNGFSNLSGGG